MTENPDSSSSPAVADLVLRWAPFVRGLAGPRGLMGVVLPWRDGVFVASALAVGRERRLAASAADGSRFMLDVIGVDPDTDVAALRLAEGESAPAVALPIIDPAPSPRTGDFVVALAADPHCGVQASFGRLGAVGGAWRGGRGGGEIDAHWRLDGGLYAGFDGALTIDAQGVVLGMASSAFSRANGVIVPAATIDRIVGQLLRDGRIVRPYLGVLLQPARVRIDGGEGVTTQAEGALVASLAEAGPGDSGGLRVGDVIVGIDGQTVDSPQALHRYVAAQAAGGTVALDLVRGGARTTLPLTLGTRPESRTGERCGHARGHRHDADRHGHAAAHRDGHDDVRRAQRMHHDHSHRFGDRDRARTGRE